MMSRRAILGVLLCVIFLTSAASAGVNVNINIGTPPPALAVVPGTYVYVATDVNENMVFYQNNWYRQHGSGWFVSLSYNGPWKAVSAQPAVLVSLPQNYHVVPPSSARMPHGQVKDNWRTWERDRHWDHQAKRDDRSDDRDRDEKEKKHMKHKKKHHVDEDHGGDRGRDKHQHEDQGYQREG